MSTYIKLLTLEYPRHEGDIRLEYPNIPEELTGDEFPCPDTYAKVLWVEPPSINTAAQVAYTIAPTCVDGFWKTTWMVRDMTEEEKAASQIHRNVLTVGVERI